MKQIITLTVLLIISACSHKDYVTYETNEAELAQLKDQIVQLENTISTLANDLSLNSDQLAVLEQSHQDLIVRVSELETGIKTVSTIDPCGDSSGFDEILLVLENSTIVAYFQSGSNRFLTTLVPGSYITTDSQKCKFTVTENGEVIW